VALEVFEMRRWQSVVVSLAALAGLACQSQVPTETASEILKELARKMVEAPDSTDEQHIAWLLGICQRQEVPERSCLRLILSDVESQKELAEHLVEARWSASRAAEQADLDELERQRVSAMQQVDRQTEVESSNLIQEYAQKKVRKERDLKAALDKTKTDLARTQEEARKQEERLSNLNSSANKPTP
jgi:hypothetical protein